MTMIVLEVPGQPVPQPRARVTKKGWAYYDPKHPIHAYRQAIEIAASGARIDGPVAFRLDVVVQRPKSHWRKHDLKPTAPPWPPGDFDNYEKGVADALKKCGVFGDDVQIVQWGGSKRWAARNETGRTTITLAMAVL
jgi:hypothetical protein